MSNANNHDNHFVHLVVDLLVAHDCLTDFVVEKVLVQLRLLETDGVT